MAFQIQITVDSIEEAERVLACLRHDNPPAAKQVAASLDAQQVNAQVESGRVNSEVAPAKPRGRPRKEPITATEVLAGQEPIVQIAQNAEDESLAPVVAAAQQTLTLDDAKAALKGVQAKYGTADLAKPLEVLKQFDAGRISEVKPERYAEFIAACQAA